MAVRLGRTVPSLRRVPPPVGWQHLSCLVLLQLLSFCERVMHFGAGPGAGLPGSSRPEEVNLEAATTQAVLGLRITCIGRSDLTFQPGGRGPVGDRQPQEGEGALGLGPGGRWEELPWRCWGVGKAVDCRAQRQQKPWGRRGSVRAAGLDEDGKPTRVLS